jgi:serine/threonine-protein kinase
VIVDRVRVEAALPGYEIGAELGRGGFGLVLAGRHRRLARPVAIKILNIEADTDDDSLARFAAEAQILANIDHPHVVRVHDYVEAEGLCLIVMEQLPGGTMRIRAGRRRSTEAVCAVGLAVAEALGRAHAAGVLHRDVKPGNILLAADGMPKVTDFGIAKIFEGSASTASALVGTWLYMAPEQWRSGRLEPATDLYALGVVLYELLTGQSPFGARLSPAAMMQHHLDVLPPAPQGVPEPVAAVILQALAKDVTDRQQTARAFAVELARAAADTLGHDWLVRSEVPLLVDDEVRDAARTAPQPRPLPAPPPTSPPVENPAPNPVQPPSPGVPVPPVAVPPVTEATKRTADTTPTAETTKQIPYAVLTAEPAERVPDPDPLKTWSQSGDDQVDTRRPPGPTSGDGRDGVGDVPAPPFPHPERKRLRSRRFVIGLAAALVIVMTVVIVVILPGNDGSPVAAYSGPTVHAQLARPIGVMVDRAGDLYIADTSNNRVRRVDADGRIITVAGTGQNGFSGDNGPATQAQLYYPEDVAIDGAGNLYIADRTNNRIRRIGTDGRIITIAGTGQNGFSGDNGPATQAQFDGPFGVAVDATGNLYIASPGNSRVRRVDTHGRIITVAGNGQAGFSGDNGPATQAQLDTPARVAVDPAGNLYIADSYNNRVRRVDTNGRITTVAGNGQAGFSGDNGPATQAQLSNPYGVAVDAAGNLYVADCDNNRIRRVDTDGRITTVVN